MMFIGIVIGNFIAEKITKEVAFDMEFIELKENSEFEYVLEVPKLTLITIISIFVLLAGLLVGVVFSAINKGTTFNFDSVVGLSVILLGMGLLVPFYLEQKNKYISFSNTLIRKYSIFQKHIVEFSWTEITAVEFQGRNRLVIYNESKQIEIYKMNKGSLVVLRLIYDKLDLNLYRESLVNNKNYFELMFSTLTEEEQQEFASNLDKQ